nr:beta-lactamase family protein [Longispora sp. (in: high G+C Gram-positive bacteria)]
MTDLDIPGAIVGISVPGKIDYLKPLGTSDKTTNKPMSLDDHVRIGSLTKSFTGTAILQLVDKKLVSLDDPISKYIAGAPSGEKITLKLMGEMRSGLFSYSADEDFVKSLFTEPPKGPDAAVFTPQQLVDIAFKHPLNFEPGTDFEYSNTNTVLLGMVIEKVAGQPLGEYLEKNIFEPLGLTKTNYPSNGDMPAPFSHGCTNQTLDESEADSALWNPSWGNAAGAIVSTYADVKVWANDLAKGSLLTPATQKARIESMKQSGPGSGYGFAMFDLHGWIGHNG